VKSLAAVYGDLLQFCTKARSIYTENGVKRRLTSFRMFWRIQWTPFEEDFGRIEEDWKHHLNVLSHSGQALALNASLDASEAAKSLFSMKS
jgi:ankyrin repeat domain-containing protein 50